MSARLVGNPDWVVQPEYPELSGQNGDETITLQIIATAAGMVNLPSYGEEFKSDDPFFSSFSWLVLTTRTVKAIPGKQTYLVTLVYTTPDNAAVNYEATVSAEVEYTTQDVDIPLAQHENYRMCWDHVLIARSDTNHVPGWYFTATDQKIPDDYAGKYAWMKPGDKIPDGWICAAAETKPGVESFRQGICTVTETRKSTNKNYLSRSSKSDYTIQKPPDTFGRPGEWLRGGSSIRKNGRYWELTVAYLNANRWDRDLYNSSDKDEDEDEDKDEEKDEK